MKVPLYRAEVRLFVGDGEELVAARHHVWSFDPIEARVYGSPGGPLSSRAGSTSAAIVVEVPPGWFVFDSLLYRASPDDDARLAYDAQRVLEEAIRGDGGAFRILSPGFAKGGVSCH